MSDMTDLINEMSYVKIDEDRVSSPCKYCYSAKTSYVRCGNEKRKTYYIAIYCETCHELLKL